MKSKLTFVKTHISLVLVMMLILNACKKDQLTLDQEKEFVEVGYVRQSGNFYDNPYTLTLMTDDKADILPGGDIVSRGTYKINGKNLTVKADNQTFKFDILSENEINIKGSETIPRLQ